MIFTKIFASTALLILSAQIFLFVLLNIDGNDGKGLVYMAYMSILTLPLMFMGGLTMLAYFVETYPW